ncbi:hypothetical protein ABVK25_010458 [Lepraria finkii]|uniref:Uncharacterized protein n=1 Tax=Lepraria finkii TaxID=1340010 RepID=A0ABR4AUB0_9LECA
MISIAFLTSFLVTRCLGQLQSCFDPDGEFNSDLIPCDPDAPVSACCGSGYICDTVLDCIEASTGVEYVPGCTDQTFADDACPWPMNATSTDDPFNPPVDLSLNITICADETACAVDVPSCCDDDEGIYIIYFENLATIPSASALYSAYYAAASSSFAIPTGDASSEFASVSAASSSLFGVRTIVSVDTVTASDVGPPGPTFGLTSRPATPLTTTPPPVATKATKPSSPTVSSQTKSGGYRVECGPGLAIGALALSAVQLFLS